MIDENKLDLELIGQRLRIVRGKLSLDDFASALDIHKNTYRNYEKGVRPFGIELIFKLEDIGINSMWVLKREGTPFSNDNAFLETNADNHLLPSSFYEDLRSLSQTEENDIENNNFTNISETYREWDRVNDERDPRSHSQDRKGSEKKDNRTTYEPSFGSGRSMDAFAHIPLYEVKAAAGNGIVVSTEHVIDSLAFKNEWIHNELHVNPAHLYLIYVEGESMEPSLRPGDVILVDHSDNTARRDGIYVIRMDGALLVKRLQRLPGAKIRVSSDNPAYTPFEIDLVKVGDGVAVIGRVVWTGRKL